MPAEADVAFLVEKTWVVVVVYGVWIMVATIGCNVVTLAGFTDITVENHVSINGDSDVITHGTYLFTVPLAHRTEVHMLRNNDTIHRAVLLILAQSGIDGRIMIEHLYLHSFVGSVDTFTGADTNTIVHTLLEEAELKAIYEIAVGLIRIKIATRAISGTHIDCTIIGNIVGLVAKPLVETLSIKQEFEALLLLLRRESIHGDGVLLLFLHLLDKSLNLVYSISGIGIAQCLLGCIDALSLNEHVLHSFASLQRRVLGYDAFHGRSRSKGRSIVANEVFSSEIHGWLVVDISQSSNIVGGERARRIKSETLLIEIKLLATILPGVLHQSETTLEDTVFHRCIALCDVEEQRQGLVVVHGEECIQRRCISFLIGIAEIVDGSFCTCLGKKRIECRLVACGSHLCGYELILLVGWQIAKCSLCSLLQCCFLTNGLSTLQERSHSLEILSLNNAFQCFVGYGICLSTRREQTYHCWICGIDMTVGCEFECSILHIAIR